MKTIVKQSMIKLLKVVVVTTLIGGSLAPLASEAAGGCGLGYHRGPYGGCVPNGPYWLSTHPYARPGY